MTIVWDLTEIRVGKMKTEVLRKKKKTRILTNTSTAFLFFPLHFIVLEKFSAPLSWPVSLSSEDTDAV